MALVDELKAVFYVVGRTIKELIMGERNPLSHYLKEFGFVVALLLLGAGGYFGYRWHIASREHKAYHSFADYLQDFQSAVKSDNKAEWERIVSLLSNGYVQHKGSNVAPLFLSLKSDAQIHLGELVEAGNTVQQAITALPKESPLAPLFMTKHALLQLDATDEALQKNGIQELVALARDEKNPYKDMALFYLGRYYWAHDQITEAKNAWQDLEDSSWIDSGKAYPSPWIGEVQQKLKQLAA